MIRFTLACDNGHQFESWFRDNASFDVQARRGLVDCPHCGSTKVEKAIMAPAVARTDRGRTDQARTDQARTGPTPVATLESDSAPPESAPSVSTPMAALSPQDHAMREMVRAFRQHVQANAENVGDRFADEARRMHHGEIEHRSIYGSATPDEVKALREEGVEAHPLPRLPDDLN
jgi:hypothetical protein